MRSFLDGVTNFVSSLVNRRNVANQNRVAAHGVDDHELRSIYKTGLGSKIVRLKAGHALKDTIQFQSTEDEKFYKDFFSHHVKDATKFCLAFGRGLIVIHDQGATLSEPLRKGSITDWSKVRIHVFSGDMVSVQSADVDLNSANYMKPRMYQVRNATIHPSRCVDFTYVEPVELEAPEYRYGGISEFELIYQQIISDGIVERASPHILEKNATIFYKVKGFKEAMRLGKEGDMVDYYSKMEQLRGIWGSGLVDDEDTVESVGQTLSNLADADQITLRRLAMVTGLPISWLVGENVKGLNSSGDNEREIFQNMIEALEHDYLETPINRLMALAGRGPISFKENQGETPSQKINFDTKVIENAYKLWEMGQDGEAYLKEKNVIIENDFEEFFKEEIEKYRKKDMEEAEEEEEESEEGTTESDLLSALSEQIDGET